MEAKTGASIASDLKSNIYARLLEANREMSSNFHEGRKVFRRLLFRKGVQLKEDDEKICVICYEDLKLDESFEVSNSVEIMNIPSTVGKHHVVAAMAERNLPMPSKINYLAHRKFKDLMRAVAEYASVEEAQYVVKTLTSNALKVKGSILEFKPMPPKSRDSHVPIQITCGHHFGSHCLNTWIAGWQKPEEQLTCPLCREPILPKWKASPLYTKIRKETSSKIGEGQWYKSSTPEEFRFRLNALLWHPIYYKEFIPLFTETLIILLTNNLADDTLEALDRSLSIIEGVVRFIVPGLEFDDRGEAQRKANRPLKDLEKDLELTRRYYELKDWVEKVSKSGYDWSPGEVKNMCQCAQMLLLDIAYTYDDVTGGRNNDLDGQVAKVEFLDNNELRYRIKNRKKCAISNERWFSECASVVDALGRGQGKYNKWLMDRAKILNKERKKYLTKLKAANKLRMESNQSLEYVKQVKTLERYHKKLAGACNEVDVSEHKERKDNKRPMDRAKIMKKERKEPLTKQKRNKLSRKPNQSPEY